MAQDYVVSDPSSGLTIYKSEEGNSLEALRSSFSGGAFPTSPTPVEGQVCYRTDLDALFLYHLSAWWPMTKLDSVVSSSTPAGTGEETIRTKTMSGDLKLDADGKGWEIEAVVAFAANGNNKRVRLQLDGTDIVDTGAVAFNASSIRLTARIIRTGATAQSAWGAIDCTNAAHLGPVRTQSNPAKTLSNSLALDLKVTCPTTNTDATVTFWAVRPIC